MWSKTALHIPFFCLSNYIFAVWKILLSGKRLPTWMRRQSDMPSALTSEGPTR